MKKFLLYSFSWLLFASMLSLHAQEIPTGYYEMSDMTGYIPFIELRITETEKYGTCTPT